MKPLFEIIKEKTPSPQVAKKQPKVEHEFQALGLEMQEHFGKEYKNRIWPLFYRHSVPIIREAWFAYQKGQVKDFKYFIGILYKLKK